MVILAETEVKLEEALTEMNKAEHKREENADFRVNELSTIQTLVRLYNRFMEEEEDFSYLGNKIAYGGRCGNEVKSRIK